MLSEILFLYKWASWDIIVKLDVLLQFSITVFWVKSGFHILESHSLIQCIEIWFRIALVLKHLSILLLLTCSISLLSVGILSSCELVSISLFVFADRWSICFVHFVRRLDSCFSLIWEGEQIWSKYSNDGDKMVLRSQDICIGRSFLYWII